MSSGALIAFVGTTTNYEIRGMQNTPSNPPFGPYAGTALFQITIYANNAGDSIGFAFSDSAGVHPLLERLDFSINGNTGTVLSPLPAELHYAAAALAAAALIAAATLSIPSPSW